MKDNRIDVSSTLRWISCVPNLQVIKYSGYVVNGNHFTTKERDDTRTTQNSGVSLIAKTMQFSSAKDKRPIYCDMVFYGVIKEIWELDYVAFRIPLFKCDWVESNNGVYTDKYGFTFVNLSRLGHKEEPFVMASQVQQVFYVNIQSNQSWSRVFSTQPRDYGRDERDDDNSDNIVEQLTPSKGLNDNILDPKYNLEDIENHIRQDGEGIWIDKNS